MKFKDLLEEYRERSGHSKTSLAQRVGVTPSYIMEIESGKKKPPTFELCQKIFDALKMTPDEQKQMFKLAFEERISEKDFDFLAHGLKIIYDGTKEK